MLHADIVERLSRLPSGGVINDKNRFDFGYLSSVLDTFRAKVIVMQYNGDRLIAKNGRINPQCLQKYWPVYEKDLQQSGFRSFRCPEIINIDSLSDGFRYIGSIDGSCNFRRVKSRADLSMFNQNKIMNVNSGRFQAALYDGSNQIIEVYGNSMLKELLVEAVFAQPLSIPTFNKDFDQYPLNDDLIPLLEDLVSKQTLLEASMPLVSDPKNVTNQ